MRAKTVGGSGDLRHRLSAHLVRAWERRGPTALLLAPLTLIYALLMMVRRLGYQSRLFASRRVDCTVIVVGNAVAGGAGKTPTTIGIVQHLCARGIAVAVVSRGYGRTSEGIGSVQLQSSVLEVGDEPLLIARATGVPVWVGRDRYATARALLQVHPQTQVIVCDDGLQHYALFRDIEICVLDERHVGNGWLLPSGPLREPWPRKPLSAAGPQTLQQLLLQTGGRVEPGSYAAHRRLADQAHTHAGDAIALRTLQGPLLALAGIAKPEAFFSLLRAKGLVLQRTLPLPDHFDFSRLDVRLLEGYQVLCTEKDADKLRPYWPQALAVPLVQTLEPAFLTALDRLLDTSLPHST